MSAEALDVVVVGAGVAGLAAGLELRRFGADVAVLEATEHAGGALGTGEAQGFRFERGPNAFRVPAEARAFFERHGLASALLRAGPEAGRRFLFLDGRALPVPDGPLALLRTPLLTPAGKRRALRELFVPRGDAADESVAEFVTRRFGPELLERAVGPFLVGVYAGDERALGAEAVFPSLVAFERRHGSVLRGALASSFGRRATRGLPGSWSAQGGLGALAERLGAGLGAALRLATPVAALARDGAGFRLETPAGELAARAVLLAVPAPAAAALLRPLDREAAAALDAIAYAPLASVALDVDPAATRQPIEGFGLLVPRQAELELLGALFMSRVFPGRAPEGRELVMAMLGGLRTPALVEADDGTLLEAAHRGLEATLGLREPPALLGVTRWPRAVAQPGPGHPARVRALRARVAALGPLALAGGHLDGVAVANALLSGVRAAAELGRT